MSDAASGGSRGGAAILELDVPCDWCGHSLRGLPLEGECPECQLAVEHSLRPTRIDLADPRWLGRLRLGVLLVLIQTLATLALILLTSVMPGPVGGSLASGWRWVPFGLAAQFVGVVGGCLITSAEPGLRPSRAGQVRRAITRGLLIAAFLVHATIFGLAWSDSADYGVAIQFVSLTLAATFAEIAGAVALLLWIRGLAVRSKAIALATVTRMALAGRLLEFTCASGSALQLSLAYAAALNHSPSRLPLGSLIAFRFLFNNGLAVLISLFVTGVLVGYLILFTRLRHRSLRIGPARDLTPGPLAQLPQQVEGLHR